MSRVTHRPASQSDHEALEALQRRSALADPGDREWLSAHPEVLRLPAGHLTARTAVVALEHGTPVGFAVVLPREAGDAELDGIFVDPARWRRGIGRELVSLAAGLATGLGATRLWVIAGEPAVPFYAACGFRLAGTAPTLLRRAPLLVMPLAR